MDIFQSTTIREMTVAQIYRHARELYLHKKYQEAIPAFQKMISLDCHNKLAHYHLKLIIKKSSSYAYLNQYLNDLNCQQERHDPDGLIPSSFFYETDPSLLQAHMIQRNRKNIETQQHLENILKEYVTTTNLLQTQVNDLSLMIETNKITMETTEITLLEAQATAEQLRSQIDALKQQLTTTPNTTPIISTNQHHQTINTLQEQLENIQQQLNQIETTIINKNNHLNIITNNLPTLRK